MAAAGDLDDRRASLAISDLRALRMNRVPHGSLLDRCWQLRSNLTVYDAVYVALAESVDAVLLTGDRSCPALMARAAGLKSSGEGGTRASFDLREAGLRDRRVGTGQQDGDPQPSPSPLRNRPAVPISNSRQLRR